MPVVRGYFEELKVAKTIREVFKILGDYFSFFSYDIIEHIVKGLGTKNNKAGLQSYKENFKQYAERRIFECPPEYSPVSDHPNHAPSLIVKLDVNHDNYTVAAIETLRRRLSDIFHISPKGVLRLCQVEEGCVQLTFQMPSFVQQKIFPLSEEQEKALVAENVIRLTCGEYQFPHDEDFGGRVQIGTDGGKFLHLAISIYNYCTL